MSLGGGNSNMFGIFTPHPWGNDSHFDEHMLQMGWNHKLVTTVDGSEIPRPTTWHIWNPVINGIFSISTGVLAGFLNHQQYDQHLIAPDVFLLDVCFLGLFFGGGRSFYTIRWVSKYWWVYLHWLGIIWWEKMTRWWFQIFLFSSKFVEMIQVDGYIFQMGWFNHRLDSLVVFSRMMCDTRSELHTWRIIPFSKWLITMISKSPKDRVAHNPFQVTQIHGLEMGVIQVVASDLVLHLPSSGGFNSSPVRRLKFSHGRWKFAKSFRKALFAQMLHILCLFHWFFYGFYQGKSPLNHHLGNIFVIFAKHRRSKSKTCMQC